MNYKNILIGLIGGGVAGYIYYEYMSGKKESKTISQATNSVEPIAEESTRMGTIGGGGGAVMSTPDVSGTGVVAPTGTTDTATTDTGTTDTGTTAPTGNVPPPILPATTSPTIDPRTYTRPISQVNDTPITSTVKPSLTKDAKVSAKPLFSGFGGQVFEAENDNMDL